MTMPTAERERQHRQHVECEAHVMNEAERGDDGRRNRNSRDHRGSKVAQEQQHDEGREHRANNEVSLYALHRGLDEFGLVAHDTQRIAGRERRLELREPVLHGVHDRDRVHARLLANLQQYRGVAVDAGESPGIGHAVLDACDVPDENRVASVLPGPRHRRTRRVTRLVLACGA